jgi:hypothetical protein
MSRPRRAVPRKVLYLEIKRKNPGKSGVQNPTGRINNWRNVLNVLLLEHGHRLAHHQLAEALTHIISDRPCCPRCPLA